MSNQTTDEDFSEVESIVIRFAGDSGDGMQLTGSQFTNTSAILGNDISTLPDFPAEIRAPAGTIAGVSGFQINISRHHVYTPGDAPAVLVAMNPAALKACLSELSEGATIIINTDAFTPLNLKKAEYESNPLEDESLNHYQVIPVPLTTINREALKEIDGLDSKEIDRSKNLFALGLTYWMFDRPLENTLDWLKKKFANKPQILEANCRSLRAGYYFGDTTRTFQQRYRIKPATLSSGTYRNISGNAAIAAGLVTAAKKMGKPLFYGSYPITPASDILHSLAPLRHFDVRTFQAEDEIAAMGSVIGAAFGGALAVTGTSGPGLALKTEAMGLAIMLELPMIVINVQRGGPSTGSPTKTEQSDLLQSMFGRNGESPIAILAPQSPADCFDIAIEAARLAVKSMSPVMILSDGFLANSSEPWKIPNPDDIAEIEVKHPGPRNADDPPFLPYLRNPETMARPWAIPGTVGLEHRLGGLNKAPETGNVSYDPFHHEQMHYDRIGKLEKLANVIPEQRYFGPSSADLLMLSWGGSYGAVRSAVEKALKEGKSVAHAHIRYINPFPKNLSKLMGNYKKILLPELNAGQLAFILRGKYGVDVQSYAKLHSNPFKIKEVYNRILQEL